MFSARPECSSLYVLALVVGAALSGCADPPEMGPPGRTDGSGAAPSSGYAGLYRSGGILPSRLAECARYQDAVGGEVRRHLSALPGVQSVSAVVSLPACDPLAAALGAAEPASASVVLARAGGRDAQAHAAIAELAAAAVAGLRPERVAVVVTEVPPAELVPVQLATVGPFAVTRESRAHLLWTAVAALGLIFGLALWAFVGERINARLRARIAHLEGIVPNSHGAEAPLPVTESAGTAR